MNGQERMERAEARRRKAEALAARLRLLRTLRGYTQDVLALRSGVPRQLISLLERGRRPRPEDMTLERLALALGVSVEQLRGKVPIPELEAGEVPPGGVILPVPPSAAAPAPGGGGGPMDYVTALGILPPLPPGSTLTVRRNGDGSTTVSLHIPAAAEAEGCPRNRPATSGE